MKIKPTKERTFGRKDGAIAAVKREGLYLMQHTFEQKLDKRWIVNFTVDLLEDARELERRGFRSVFERGEEFIS